MDCRLLGLVNGAPCERQNSAEELIEEKDVRRVEPLGLNRSSTGDRGEKQELSTEVGEASAESGVSKALKIVFLLVGDAGFAERLRPVDDLLNIRPSAGAI